MEGGRKVQREEGGIERNSERENTTRRTGLEKEEIKVRPSRYSADIPFIQHPGEIP